MFSLLTLLLMVPIVHINCVFMTSQSFSLWLCCSVVFVFVLCNRIYSTRFCSFLATLLPFTVTYPIAKFPDLTIAQLQSVCTPCTLSLITGITHAGLLSTDPFGMKLPVYTLRAYCITEPL